MPEVSVIIGVCNGGDLLRPTLESLVAQTFTDWEIVLVDNGSTDGAVGAVVPRLGDPRIRVLSFPEPLGPGGALAKAFAAARGRYIAVTGHDDLSLPRRLELQRAWLESHPETGVLATATALIDGDGRLTGREPHVGLHEDILACTAYVTTLRHSSVMSRREIVERVPFRPVAGEVEDLDFFARAAEVTRLASLPEILCQYRLHATNWSRLKPARMARRAGLVRMLTRRRRTGLPEDLEHWQSVFCGELPREEPGAEGRAHRACARIFARAGHADLAALHAWLGWRAGSWWCGFHYLAAVGRAGARGRFPAGALPKAWLKEPLYQLLRAGGYPDRLQV